MKGLVKKISERVSGQATIDRPIKERKFYLDLLRVIAISAVVLIHVSASYVSEPDNAMAFAIGNIFDSISRLGVPLFLMISGALLLDEDKDFDFKKKIYSLFIPWFTWALLYAIGFRIVIPFLKGEAFSLLAFLTKFIQGHDHLWYMWAISGLYLITPILKKFVKKENKNIVAYFIILSLLFQFTKPIITLLFEEFCFLRNAKDIYTYVYRNLNINFLGGLTTYFLAGWFLSNIALNKQTVTVLYILGALGVLCIIILTQFFPNQYSLTYSNYGLFVFFYSSAVFLLLKNLCSGCTRSNHFIVGLSNLSFGVYLVHIFVQTIVVRILPRNPLLIPITALIVLTISTIISYIISKTPIVKKVIRA